jgi:hypothetical protein
VKHKFYFGLAKNDGEGTTGDGTIAEIDFALKEGFDFNSIVIKLTSLGGIESDGSKTYIGGNLRINLGEDIDLCEGETADLSVMEGFDSYAWSSGETTSSIEVTSSGTYTVTVTDTSGMTGTDEITVTVHDNPVVDLGEDIESASDVTLDAGGGFATYSWSTGESNQTIEVTESGTYSVTVTDDYGCTGEDEIEVTITASGIIEESELAELSVYPVPAEEVIFVEVTAHRKGRMALELVDQNGARFYRQKLGKVSHYNSSVNVSRLARGIYYLQVLLDDKVVGIKKVVIH